MTDTLIPFDQEAFDRACQAHAAFLADPSGDEGERADFECWDFNNVRIEGRDLRHARFNRTRLQCTTFVNCDLSNTRFYSAAGEYTVFHQCNLGNALFDDAMLPRSSFDCSDLISTRFYGTNLRRASFSGTRLINVDFHGAQVQHASLTSSDCLKTPRDLPIVRDASTRLLEVAQTVLQDSDLRLCMSEWHTCHSTHCIAGWAIHLAGPLGELLEAEFGPANAGLFLLGPEAASHFFVDEEAALDFLHRIAHGPFALTDESVARRSSQDRNDQPSLTAEERNPALV